MIELTDLTKRYDDVTLALHRVSLNVSPGSVYCLLGANGAGKSTLVNVLLNLVRPTNGRARVSGVDCNDAHAGTRRLVGFVPSEVGFYERLSGAQNLRFFARLSGRSDATTENLRMAMREVHLPERAFDMPLGRYSGLMRQKLTLAIARMKRSPALLLDEPTGGLDPAGSAEFLSLVLEMKREGKAILLATHDANCAWQVADRVGILKRGVLILEVSREELRPENLQRLSCTQPRYHANLAGP